MMMMMMMLMNGKNTRRYLHWSSDRLYVDSALHFKMWFKVMGRQIRHPEKMGGKKKKYQRTQVIPMSPAAEFRPRIFLENCAALRARQREMWSGDYRRLGCWIIACSLLGRIPQSSNLQNTNISNRPLCALIHSLVSNGGGAKASTLREEVTHPRRSDDFLKQVWLTSCWSGFK